jgi:monoamine oxidase
MTKEKVDIEILIIGAGLTGIYLAYLLKAIGKEFVLVEARNRVGGRIWTKSATNGARLEMGATWFGRQHTTLRALISELGLETFEQKLGARAVYEPISTSPPQVVSLPPNDQPSYRFVRGTESIIHALAKDLETNIQLEQVIDKVELTEDSIKAYSTAYIYNAKKIVSTLPPALLIDTVKFIPELPEDVQSVAKATHTWMGESIKVSLAYKDPFWDKDNMSGTIFSSVGPIPEMYDHSNLKHNRHALMGFFNGTYFSLTKEERLELVMNQLQKYYGNQVRDYLSYEEQVWRNDPYTFAPYKEHVLPHQNNGNIAYQRDYLDDRFIIAGTETSEAFGGYMEGAIRSAKFVAEQLEKSVSK